MVMICLFWVDLCCCRCFFFFKQKTAYEMRISDWSSDVCSSDLAEPREHRLADQMAGPGADRAADHDRKQAVHDARPSRKRRRGIAGASLVAAKIGRASCRERVCQYV